MKPNVVAGIAVAAFVAGIGVGWFMGRGPVIPALTDTRRDDALALCNRWADKLDARTTDTGVYLRWDGDTLPENDPWGQPLRVNYSKGGLAEHVEVRSVGPDGQSHTKDDVVVTRQSMNLSGVGTGIKQGAEETAGNAARGAVKGTVQGIKDALGGRKKDEGK